MTTIYTRLATLGFAEWLGKNGQFKRGKQLSAFDQLRDDDSERTVINALAFRWLREEKDLECLIEKYYPKDSPTHFEFILYRETKKLTDVNHSPTFPSYELASIACLEKAEEILTNNPTKHE